jgi:hypothetical protein
LVSPPFLSFLTTYTNIGYQQGCWQTNLVSPLRSPILPGRRTLSSVSGA